MKTIKLIGVTLGLGFVIGGLFFLGFFWYLSKDLPEIGSVEDYLPRLVTQVYATSQVLPDSKPKKKSSEPEKPILIGEFFKEKRFLVPFERMPELVIRAFIAAEDNTFFEHQGISPTAILRASLANLKAGHVVQGGSTITQQVAKSLFLSPERLFVRKFREAILANRIEKNLTKQQILYLYLNQIYLGHGAYGIQAASQGYFRKDVTELGLPEASLLAGMPQAPSKYSPFNNPVKAKSRQKYVLNRMVENNFITQKEMDAAVETPLRIYYNEDINHLYSAFFVEHVRKTLVQKYGEKEVYEEGLTVEVPVNPELLRETRKKFQEGLREVDRRHGYRGPIEKLEEGEAVRSFTENYRTELIKKLVPYQIFLSNGSMDTEEALSEAKVSSDVELLSSGEVYKAVVMKLDEKNKVATLLIGRVEAELTLEKMDWARNPERLKDPPKKLAEVLSKGDVLLVRLVEITREKKLLVELDQHSEVQGALFSFEVQTGRVIAMEGGYSFGKSEFNRATQALRQPGSAFKPFIYAAGIENGYTPSTNIVDAPIIYEDEDFKWKPSNFSEKFYGDTPYVLSFIKSRNIPTIKLVQDLSVSRIIEYARRIGLTGALNEDLSISLGSGETTLENLTKAYALFPRLGKRVEPVFISKVSNRYGVVLEEEVLQPPLSPQKYFGFRDPAEVAGAKEESKSSPPAGEEGSEEKQDIKKTVTEVAENWKPLPLFPSEKYPDQLMDPRVAFVMTSLLHQAIEVGTGRKAKVLKRPAAGKTGTTNDYRDAWFMGYLPRIVTGVWVGYDNQGRSLGNNETGSKAALPIWIDAMRYFSEKMDPIDFIPPRGVVIAKINQFTGKSVPESSTTGIEVAYIEGTEPKSPKPGQGSWSQNQDSVDSESEFFKKEYE